MPPHTVEVTTGFRQATFELDGFYLNGERFEIFGLNRHQLFPYTGMAAPGAAAGARRRADQERAQLQHGPLLALSAVAALPRRLRSARADGLGGAAGLAVHRRSTTLRRSSSQNVQDMVDARPQPAVGDRLGHTAGRDRELLRRSTPRPASSPTARRHTADHRRDGHPVDDRLGRGRLRLRRLRLLGRQRDPGAPIPGRPVHGQRGRRRDHGTAAVPLDRHRRRRLQHQAQLHAQVHQHRAVGNPAYAGAARAGAASTMPRSTAATRELA